MEHVPPTLQQIKASALELTPVEQVDLIETLMSALGKVLKETPQRKLPKETFYGSWTGEAVSKEDIDEVRRDMWSNAFREDNL